jgi:hypothetical protein
MAEVVAKYKIQAVSGCLQKLIEQEEKKATTVMLQYNRGRAARWYSCHPEIWALVSTNIECA